MASFVCLLFLVSYILPLWTERKEKEKTKEQSRVVSSSFVIFLVN